LHPAGRFPIGLRDPGRILPRLENRPTKPTPLFPTLPTADGSFEKPALPLGSREHALLVFSEELVPMSSDQPVGPREQRNGQPSGDSRDRRPGARQSRENPERRGFGLDHLSVLEQDDAVEIYCPQLVSRKLRLQRGEVELSGAVLAEYELHEAVAEMTNAVEQDYGPQPSSYGLSGPRLA
jgi:hypothetical protein